MKCLKNLKGFWMVRSWEALQKSTYGRKSADRTEHGNDVIFLVILATVFGNLEVWKVKK